LFSAANSSRSPSIFTIRSGGTLRSPIGKACDTFQDYGCGGGVLVAGMGGVAGAAGVAGASLTLLGAEPVEPLSDCGLQPNKATIAINIRMVALIFIVLLLLYGFVCWFSATGLATSP
jgi:hypothetical protein